MKKIKSKLKFTAQPGLVFGLLMLIISFCSCNPDDKPVESQEDYEKLFPWTGIDKPQGAYEDMNVQTCSTEQMLKDYTDLSKAIKTKRTYRVTVEFSYTQSPETAGDRYEFRYIDQNKKVKAIGTKSTQEHMSVLLENGKKYTQTFKVKSGYPMYLYVNGGGNQASGVKAKVSAKSVDGLVVVPILSTEQYQTKRGFHKIDRPFCEYIILP